MGGEGGRQNGGREKRPAYGVKTSQEESPSASWVLARGEGQRYFQANGELGGGGGRGWERKKKKTNCVLH